MVLQSLEDHFHVATPEKRTILPPGSGMMWNPAIPTLLASATVTGEVTMWEVRGDVLVQASTKQAFGASSLCWSSKVGTMFKTCV